MTIGNYFQNDANPKIFVNDSYNLFLINWNFIYNGKILQSKFFYYFTVGQYFLIESNVTIFVNDIYNLLLINWKQTKNITFILNQSFKKEITIMNDSSLDGLLGSYMCIIDHKELSYNHDNIKYLYNFQQIRFGDKETVGEFFLNDNNPIISVMDMNNLINIIAITFKTTHGDIFQVVIKPTKTLEHLLMRYLDEIYHSELINKEDKIQFYIKHKE